MTTEQSTLQLAIDARKAKEGASDMQSAANKVQDAAGKAVKSVVTIESTVERMVSKVKHEILGLVGSLAALVAFEKAAEHAIEFETALVEIKATSGLAGRELKDLGNDIDAMSRRLPVSRDLLLKIAEASGRLGMSSRDQIVRYTETIAKLGIVSNLSGVEGATAFKRFIDASSESIDNAQKLASVANALGDKTAGGTAEIVEMSRAIALMTSGYKVGAVETLAISSAVSKLGLETRAAAGAVGNTMEAIAKAVRKPGVELETLQVVTGKTAAELSNMMKTAPVDLLDAFLAGLGRMIDSGQSADVILERLGLQGDIFAKSLIPMARNLNLLRSSLTTARREWEEQVALEEDVKDKTGVLSGQIKILSNDMTSLSSNILGALGPALHETLALLLAIIDPATANSNALFLVAEGVRAAALAYVYLMGLRLISSIDLFTNATLALWRAWIAVRTVIASTPWGLLAIAVTAAVGTIIALDSASDKATDGMEKLNEAARETRNIFEDIAKTRILLERALEIGDLARQVQATENALRSLDQLREKMLTGTRQPVLFGDMMRSMITEEGKTQVEQAPAVTIRSQTKFGDFGAPGIPEPAAVKIVEEEIERLKNQIKDLRKTMQDSRNAQETPFDGKRTRDEITSTRKSLEEWIKDLEFESSIAHRTAEEREVLTARRKAEKMAIDAEIPSIALLGARIAKLTQDIIGIGKRDELKRLIRDIHDEHSTINMTNDERERAIALRQAERLVMEGQLDDGKKLIASYENEIKQFQKDRHFKEWGDELANTMGSAADNIIADFHNIKDVAKQTFLDINRIFIQQMITKPLAEQLSKSFASMLAGLFGGGTAGAAPKALGGAFLGGMEINAFAGGGVFGSPTFFGMAGNRMGVMGEKGPEAIMPLGRDSSGRLGVRASGGGGQSIIQNVKMIVNSNDPRTFRGSEQQIASRMARLGQRAMRRS